MPAARRRYLAVQSSSPDAGAANRSSPIHAGQHGSHGSPHSEADEEISNTSSGSTSSSSSSNSNNYKSASSATSLSTASPSSSPPVSADRSAAVAAGSMTPSTKHSKKGSNTSNTSNTSAAGLSSAPTNNAGNTSASSASNLTKSGNAEDHESEERARTIAGIQAMTDAESSAIEKALAAGISRDEFEKTRAGILSMLKGSHGATSAGSSKAASNKVSISQRSPSADPSSVVAAAEGAAAKSGSIPSPPQSPASLSYRATSDAINALRKSASALTSSNPNTSRHGSAPHSASSSTSHRYPPQLLSQNTSSSAASSTTLRTSVSSSQATSDEALQPHHEVMLSPPTSNDGEAEVDLAKDHEQQGQTRTGGEDQFMDDAQEDDKEHVDNSNSGSMSDPDSSYHAASAAAAALGMLASSPIKHVSPSARRDRHLSPSFTQLRTSSNNFNNAIGNSSSSPQRTSDGIGRASHASGSRSGGLETSPVLDVGSSSGGRLGSRHRQRQSADKSLSPGGRGKSTTPVRTKLEDIALKSSVQIRKQRERLGLDEEEEMMDLDMDDRHQAAIMRALGGVSSMSSRNVDDVDAEFEVDEDGPSAFGLAPPFAYAAASASTSSPVAPRYARHQQHHSRAHSRTSSIGATQIGRHARSHSTASTGRAIGMLDRFMEENASPRAAEAARFAGGAHLAGDVSSHRYRDDDPDDDDIDVFGTSTGDADATARSRHQGRQFESVDADDGLPSQSTPKSRARPSRLTDNAARAQHGDFESPLSSQARPVLSEVDGAGAYADGRPLHPVPIIASRASPYSRRTRGRRAGAPVVYLEEPGYGSSSDTSVAGSARKRKASYDLTSPRQVVRGHELTSEPDSPSSASARRHRDPRSYGTLSPPPAVAYQSFPSPSAIPHGQYPLSPFAPASPRFSHRQSAAHPGHTESEGLFNGPPAPSQSSSRASTATASAPPSAQKNLYDPQRDTEQEVRQQHPTSGMRASRPALERAAHSDKAPQEGLSRSSSMQSPLADRTQPREPSSESASQPVAHAATGGRKKDRSKKRAGGNAGNSASLLADESGPQSSALSATLSASSTVAPLPADFVFANVQPGQYDAKTKPPFSYAALIGQAIFSTPDRRMSLADIYSYIMGLYPFYKKQDAGWQNSIRHNLSLNECFVKTQRQQDEPGKGCLWSVAPGTEEQFTGGNFYKKGKVPKSGSSSNLSFSSSMGASASGGNTPQLGNSMALHAASGGAGYNDDRDSLKLSIPAPSSRRGRKAESVMSQGDSMSIASGDDSYDNLSAHSASFLSNSSHYATPPLSASHHQYHYQHMPPQQQQYPVAAMTSAGYSTYHAQEAMPGYPQTEPAQRYSRANVGPAISGSRPRASSNLRQQSHAMYDEPDEEDLVALRQPLDVRQPMESMPRQTRAAREEDTSQDEEAHVYGTELIQHHKDASPKKISLRIKREPHDKRAGSGRLDAHEQAQGLKVHEDRDQAYSDRSISAEPASQTDPSESTVSASLSSSTREPPEERQRVPAHTSPVGRASHPMRGRNLLTSPPVASSPPTNVFARMSQPYQPFRTAFNIPGQSSERAAALMSSPPPSGIMPSDGRSRQLPPPTPRSMAGKHNSTPGRLADDGTFASTAGSSIFLPAPNIRPGKPSSRRSGKEVKADSSDDFDGEAGAKPILPPISMMQSPVSSSMIVNTQSPISSLRGSSHRRSTSPSPKGITASAMSRSLSDALNGNGSSTTNSNEATSADGFRTGPMGGLSNSQHSSASASSKDRSPTLNRSKQAASLGDVFKTPDRFSSGSGHPLGTIGSVRDYSSPTKQAAMASSTNASKALQSIQSTPKVGGSRSIAGLVTPGGYYDPYEYGALLDEELDRMAKSSDGDAPSRSERRPMPYPSPLDRTPKWQPWSPW